MSPKVQKRKMKAEGKFMHEFSNVQMKIKPERCSQKGDTCESKGSGVCGLLFLLLQVCVMRR